MLLSEEGAKKIPSVQDSVPDDIVLKIVAAGEFIQDYREDRRVQQEPEIPDALIHFVGDDQNQMEDFSREVLDYFNSK